VLIGLFGCAISTLFLMAPGHERWGGAISGGIAAIYLLRGLIRMARWSTLLIDRNEGTIEAWEGSILPDHRCFHVADFRAVELSCKVIQHGRGDTETRYPITLLGLGCREELIAPRDEKGTRRMADDVACFLGYDLIDATLPERRRYRADEVGVPLGERLRAEGIRTFSLPTPPARRRFTCRVERGRLAVEFPRPRVIDVLKWPALLFLILGAIGGGLVFGIGALAARSATWGELYLPATCITLGLGLVGFVIGLLGEMPGMWRRTTIEADRGEVVVRWRGLVFSQQNRADAAEVRDVLLDGLFTRDGLFRYHLAHVREQELEWLRAAVQVALAAGAISRSEEPT